MWEFIMFCYAATVIYDHYDYIIHLNIMYIFKTKKIKISSFNEIGKDNINYWPHTMFGSVLFCSVLFCSVTLQLICRSIHFHSFILRSEYSSHKKQKFKIIIKQSKKLKCIFLNLFVYSL